MSDEIGDRGQAIFFVLLTRSYGRKHHLFRPQFLGDKWPGIDFIVELIGTGSSTAYFFVQVKTTSLGYTKRTNRLKIKIGKEELKNLATYPAPTYIVGIDEVEEKGYIISAKKRWRTGISNLSTKFPINKTNQDILWKEVKDFWRESGVGRKESAFKEAKRR